MPKFIIKLLRHDDAVHREDDGAVRVDDLAEKLKAKFAGSPQWSIEAWITFLAKGGGGPKTRFEYKHCPYFRAIQGDSGGTLVEHPASQD